MSRQTKVKSYTTTDIKKGRMRVGVLYRFNSGSKLFLAFRAHRDIYRQRDPSLSNALREEHAFWGIDYDILMKMRREEVQHVGVRVKKINEIYVAPIASWMTHPRTVTLTLTGKMVRFLPIDLMLKRTDNLDIR